jgi:hypothetical protein
VHGRNITDPDPGGKKIYRSYGLLIHITKLFTVQLCLKAWLQNRGCTVFVPSVADPCHFGTDPGPRIRAFD